VKPYPGPVNASELRADPDRAVAAVHAGTVPYATAWDWQRELVRRRAADEIGDVLLTLEHPRVYTLGRRASRENVLLSDAELAARGIETYDVDRGGDVTYHGPGQLVAYPILRLRDPTSIVPYVRALEEVGIRTAASYGIDAGRLDGFSGAWVGHDKLMAIGVRVTANHVTEHGLALNVTTHLDDFDGIVPCGITDKGVCSLASLGIDTTVDEAVVRLRRAWAEVFTTPVHDADVASLQLQVRLA